MPNFSTCSGVKVTPSAASSLASASFFSAGGDFAFSADFASDAGGASPAELVVLWHAPRSRHPAASAALNVRRVQGPHHSAPVDRHIGLWLCIDVCSIEEEGLRIGAGERLAAPLPAVAQRRPALANRPPAPCKG